MVDIFSVLQVQVQVTSAAVGKGLKKLLRQLNIKVPHLYLGEGDIINQVGATGEINRHISQCFIHRNPCRTITDNPLFVSQSLAERLTQNNTDILNRMVEVYINIPLA